MITLRRFLAALLAAGLWGAPAHAQAPLGAGSPDQPSRASGEILLHCPGISFAIATGTPSGECLAQPGSLALCVDAQSSSASARCGTGCLGTNGTGSCTLSDEERIGGSFTLACDEGSRYLLRTRTGKGRCETTGEGQDRRASCSDGKSHRTEASCSEGCGKVRGSSSCARYKREADPAAR